MHPDFVCRGGGMPRPLEFYTQKPAGRKIAFPWGKVAAKRPDEGRWGLMVSASPLPPSDEGGGTEGAGGSVLPPEVKTDGFREKPSPWGCAPRSE